MAFPYQGELKEAALRLGGRKQSRLNQEGSGRITGTLILAALASSGAGLNLELVRDADYDGLRGSEQACSWH